MSGKGGGGSSCKFIYKTIFFIATVFCLGAFCWIIYDHVSKYLKYPTVTSVSRVQVPNLEFSAFTICAKSYNYERISKDLSFPFNPFGSRPPKTKTYPIRMYYKLEEYGLNVSSFVWRYYFRVDEIVHNCMLGAKDCSYPDHLNLTNLPDKDHGQFEVVVPAGKWVSRVFADSTPTGNNYMCHTLIPNVTVNFTLPGGNGFGISWKTTFAYEVDSWLVFVHDLNEFPLLHTYAMDEIPHTTILKGNADEHFKLKRKAQILPTRIQNPNTDHHLCNNTSVYSKNLCDLNYCWSRRVNQIKKAYGKNYACQLPGVWPEKKDLMPVCNHYGMELPDQPSLGLFNLINILSLPIEFVNNSYTGLPSQSGPPIGAELPSDCLERCTHYKYQLYHEEISTKDETINVYDLYLSFASNYVESWHEFESYNAFELFSDIGGTMGLLLGMSLLTIVDMIGKTALAAHEKIKNLC